MKVLVIGAGISGIATAIGLARQGHEIEVCERAAHLRAGGNGVILWPNATGILREFGVDLGGQGRVLESIETMTQDGRLLLRSDASRLARRFGAPSMLIQRSHVVRALADQLPTAIRFNREAVDCEVREERGAERASVRFADGSRAEGDVLIGADGYRSAVRRALHDDATAEYTGMTTWHGTTRSELDVAATGRLQLFLGRTAACVLHPIGQGVLHWAFEASWPGCPDPRGRPALSLLRRNFGGWARPVADLLDELTDRDVHTFPHLIHRVAGPRGSGPATLVGDAAHTLPVRTGMGVNQALEDAWVLTGAMSAADPAATRLRAYENARRPKIRRAHARALALTKNTNVVIRLLRLVGGWFPGIRVQAHAIRSASNFLR